MTNRQKDELSLIIQRWNELWIKNGSLDIRSHIKFLLKDPMKNAQDASPLQYVKCGLAYKVLEWIEDGCP